MTQTVFTMAISTSKQLLAYLIVIHGVMLITLVSLLGMTAWSLLTCVVMGVSFIYYCQQYQWLKSNYAITYIERNKEGKWTLRQKAGIQNDQLILSNCLVTQNMVILTFLRGKVWHRKSITIMSDSVDVNHFRQLRVYCREAKTFQK